MTIAQQTRDRRWFLRSTTTAALALLATGAQALLGAAPASAIHRSWCVLIHGHSSWCPLACNQRGLILRCWMCWNRECKCCECTAGDTCFELIVACSWQIGCCSP